MICLLKSYKAKCVNCNNTFDFETQLNYKMSNGICHFCLHKVTNRRTLIPDYEVLYNRFKKMAKRRNIEFTITQDYIRGLLEGSKRKCMISGYKLSINEMSLDRIDSNIGYVPGNVELVHKKINIAKHVQDKENFINMCKLISSNNE